MSTPDVGPAERVWHWPGPPELEVLAHRVRRPGGAEQTWHLLRAQGGSAGAVAIAVHAGRVLLGRAWRLPVAADAWELPRGFGEPGEDAVTTARRELLEEAGVVGDEGSVLGSFFPDTGVLANRVDVVRLVVDDPHPEQTDGELGAWRWCSPDELDQLIGSGEIVDGITLAAVLLWRRAT